MPKNIIYVLSFFWIFSIINIPYENRNFVLIFTTHNYSSVTVDKLNIYYLCDFGLLDLFQPTSHGENPKV